MKRLHMIVVAAFMVVIAVVSIAWAGQPTDGLSSDEAFIFKFLEAGGEIVHYSTVSDGTDVFMVIVYWEQFRYCVSASIPCSKWDTVRRLRVKKFTL